ncbi:MAG: hypothetical protein HN576_07755 [Bacteriovoracaceae bacterium]|jgi:hypothetical protein|nr:hypothetical protein [Bacteriovoracaceae bacterium]
MKKLYFKELAKKIEVDVPKELDHRILSAIPYEEEENFFKIGFSFALAASLAFIIYMNFGIKKTRLEENSYAISEMMENKDMYEQMELLGQIEDLELSDADWKILLEQEEETDV